MTAHQRAQKPVSDERVDRMNARYWVEYDRWCWRRNLDKGGFELVRNTSPGNDINADEYFGITSLSKRECADRHDAEMWHKTYATRAAMRAALEAL